MAKPTLSGTGCSVLEVSALPEQQEEQMGSRVNGQGQSRYTRKKEEFFGMCLGHHMAVQAGRSIERPYFHVDLTAGSGRNDIERVKGTPELFLTQAGKHRDLPIHAFFVEKHRKRAERLRGLLQTSPKIQRGLFGVERYCRVIRGDNREFLPKIPSLLKALNGGKPRGSIISDPNGYSVKQGGLDLGKAAEVFRCLDEFILLISFCWGRAKRVRGYVERGERGPIKNPEVRTVADFLPLRRHWLISEPAGQWVYLCGSSVPFPEDRRRGTFTRLTSPRGRAILHYCDEIGARLEESA